MIDGDIQIDYHQLQCGPFSNGADWSTPDHLQRFWYNKVRAMCNVHPPSLTTAIKDYHWYFDMENPIVVTIKTILSSMKLCTGSSGSKLDPYINTNDFQDNAIEIQFSFTPDIKPKLETTTTLNADEKRHIVPGQQEHKANKKAAKGLHKAHTAARAAKTGGDRDLLHLGKLELDVNGSFLSSHVDMKKDQLDTSLKFESTPAIQMDNYLSGVTSSNDNPVMEHLKLDVKQSFPWSQFNTPPKMGYHGGALPKFKTIFTYQEHYHSSGSLLNYASSIMYNGNEPN